MIDRRVVDISLVDHSTSSYLRVNTEAKFAYTKRGAKIQNLTDKFTMRQWLETIARRRHCAAGASQHSLVH